MLDEMGNKAVHRAFITQSWVLMNSLQNPIKNVADGTIPTEIGYVGKAFTSPESPQPIPPTNQSARAEHPTSWPYSMPDHLWTPSANTTAEASSLAGEQSGDMIPMTTKTIVPASGTPRPTIPAPGTISVAITSGLSVS